MILVDTSVWVDYLRDGNIDLEGLLNNGQVMCHSFIIGEIACGNIKNRTEILSLLRLLPRATSVENEEVLYFIDSNKLMGLGLGYIDMHLAASAVLNGVRLWTFDKRLNDLSRKLNICYE